MTAIQHKMNLDLQRRTDTVSRHYGDPNFEKPISELTKTYPSKEWAKIHQL